MKKKLNSNLLKKCSRNIFLKEKLPLTTFIDMLEDANPTPHEE